MTCTIAPLSDHTGAEVRGVDLAQPVDPAIREQLNRAFVDRSRAGVPRPDAEPAAGAGRGAAVRRGVPAAQHALRHPGMPADPLHFQPGQIPGRHAATSPARAGIPTIPTMPARPRRRCCMRCNCRTRAATRSSPTCTRAYAALPEATRQRIDELRRSTSIRAATARGN